MIRFLRVLVWAIFFLAATHAYAATTISFSNNPSTIDRAQDFFIDVSLICNGCSSDSYLRAVFYPSGTNYFGFTQRNDGTWVNAPGGSCTQYFKIAPSDLTEGTWSGKLKVKPDVDNSAYNGPGDYLFKVGRYTTSCSAIWSTETTITIIGPTPTPSPTPTPTPTNAPTPTITPTPTSTPTPTPIKTPTPTPTKMPTRAPTPTLAPTLNLDQPTTLSGIPVTPEATPVVLGVQEENQKPQTIRLIVIPILFISLGLAIIAGVLVWKKRNSDILVK